MRQKREGHSLAGPSLAHLSLLSSSGGVGSQLKGTGALRKDEVVTHVLFLMDVQVSCHKLAPILALAVPTGCWQREALALMPTQPAH